MFDRREAMGAIGGGLALAAAAPVAAATAPFSLVSPAGRMRAFILMRGAIDDRLVTGCFTAPYWGCVNGVMTPLFDVVSVIFSRYRRLADGGYRSVSLEQSYFIDRLTGEWLQKFVNPYTGKTVEVPTGGYPPSAVVYLPNLELQVGSLPPGMVLNHVSSPFTVEGDAVMMSDTVTATTTPPGGGRAELFYEVTTFHASLAALRRPNVKQVGSGVSYTNVKSWRKWLEMADHPGETISIGQGSFGVPFSDLPVAWVKAARRHRPQLLADPAKLLDPLWHAA